MFKEKIKQNDQKKKQKRKSPSGKQNYRVLPRRTGVVGANLWPFSFGGSVRPLRLSPQPLLNLIYREKTVTYIHKYVQPRIQVFTCIHTYIYFY